MDISQISPQCCEYGKCPSETIVRRALHRPLVHVAVCVRLEPAHRVHTYEHTHVPGLRAHS